jgi:hypothetical protein
MPESSTFNFEEISGHIHRFTPDRFMTDDAGLKQHKRHVYSAIYIMEGLNRSANNIWDRIRQYICPKFRFN